jgi:FeS assembly SUF system protein
MSMEYSPFGGFMPTPLPEDGLAHAGAPLDPSVPVAEQAAVIEGVKTVYDPEIPVNIYELGLIYSCEIADDGTVKIDMTLTAPACPVAGILPVQVAEAAAAVAGVGEVTVEVVWDPPWDPSRMSEAARVELDMF